MIRYIYIQHQVLDLYMSLPKIKFPLDVKSIINYIPNCKYMSYEQFASINNCTINEVIKICESKSGCTHYDLFNNRYLILCNQSLNNNNNLGRQRWTLGHEIGHVLCNHHALSAYDKLSENSLSTIINKDYEVEADYFSATLLAPFPLFSILSIKSPTDIQKTFGLSTEASLYRFKQYQNWKITKIKSAWENDMIKIYKRSNNII